MLLRKKKKIFLVTLITILVASICHISSVYGAISYNGASYPGGGLGDCKKGENCIWHGNVGIRYSLVDENGEQVSGTHHIDLWPFDKMKTYYYKNYQLYNDDDTLLFDFSGAYYGTQIKQHVINKPAGSLQTGTYFQNSNVYNIKTVFPTITFSYDRWKVSSAREMAKWLENVTSTESHADMENLLKYLGYGGDGSGSDLTIAAANAGYYVQYEPIVTHGRVGSGINNYIIAATPTEYYKYDKKLSGADSPWLNNKTTGVYIFKDEAPKNFTTGTGSGVSNLLSKDANGKIYGEGVAHMWLADLIDTGVGCVPAVEWINANYTPGTDEYRAKIQEVINGTLVYKEGDVEKKIDKAYPHHENLYEKNYMKLPSKQAACTSNKIVSEKCEQAIAYINSNYAVGSPEYHQAVAEVRNGTFVRSIVNADGTLTNIKIDGRYDNAAEYPLLVQSNYAKLNGGKASCGKPTCSDLWSGSDVYVDDCESGKSFFGDIDDEDAWLVCEIAFTDDSGKVYSSDNTGHDAVESTNGGIVGNVEYCELFCYESFETQFPTKVYNVKAGQTFVWGSANGMFGDVEITKKCSNQSYIYGMQGYRFEEWEEDYNENETEMIRFYMNKASYEIAASSSFRTSSSKYYTCNYRCSCKCSSGKGRCCCGYKGCPRYRATATSQTKTKTYSHSYVGSVTGKAPSTSYSVSGYTSRSAAISAAKAGLKSKLLGLASQEKAKYDGNKIKEAELLVKIRQCTNNLEYAYKTVVKFIFEEPINEAYGANSRMFEYNGELEVTGKYNQDNVDTSKCKTFKAYSYTCSGTGSGARCTPKLEEVLDCSVVTWDITGRYIYNYPEEDFIWYTLKTDSTLLNEKDKIADKGSVDDNFFYYVGFGLPTALSLTNGEYYRLKVIVTNLGDNADTEGAQQYNTVDGHFWPLTEKIATGEGYGFEYVCAYEVENEIFGYDCRYDSAGNLIYASPAYCDETEDDRSKGSLVGIDVAYRLVTLLTKNDTIYKAFPGMSGGGRPRGTNWAYAPMVLREILRTDVYDTDQAMYEIMLDINAINYIREDNEKYFDSGRDPYTSFYDENNRQKVYCASVGGSDDDIAEIKYCASDFISSLYLKKGLNYPLRGTCLPTGNTLERAEYILENGCDVTYTYPSIKWIRGES